MIKLLLIFFMLLHQSNDYVYIIDSPYAYAYHKTPDCVGLSKTKCIIRKVSKDEAAKTRKPCGYCYGYIRRGKDLDRDSTYIAR